jgi:hypothetical protein
MEESGSVGLAELLKERKETEFLKKVSSDFSVYKNKREGFLFSNNIWPLA